MPTRSTSTTIYESGTTQKLKSPTPQMGQGPSTQIAPNSLEDRNNKHGFTHPDLHRTIDPADPQILCEQDREQMSVEELAPREYSVGIYDVNSYRTSHKIVHTEEEFIRIPSSDPQSPYWNECDTGSEEFVGGGSWASWQGHPPQSSPAARGTPDEIP